MENSKVDIPKSWIDFVAAFDRLFPTDFADNGVFYPDFKCFSDLEKMLVYYLAIDYDIPVSTSDGGKTATFKILPSGIGIKEMPGDGILYTNVSILEYQSIDVKETSGNAVDVFMSSIYKKLYIDVPALPFFNQTYIHMVLDKILRAELGFGRMYVKQLYAVVQVNKNAPVSGITAMVVSDKSTLHYYLHGITDPNVMMSNLKTGIPQILEVLLYLKSKRFLFNHNDLKTKNVFVSSSGNGVIWQLADFDKSAISYKGYRFRFNNTRIANVGGYSAPSDASTYILNNLTYGPGDKILLAQRIMCSPFFWLSYDVYTLIVSILLHPNVLKLLFTQQEYVKWIVNLVNVMFTERDSNSFLEIMRNAATVSSSAPTADYSSITVIAQLISGYTLKSDPNFIIRAFPNDNINVTTSYDDIYQKTRSPRSKLLMLSLNTGMFSSWTSGLSSKYHICSAPCKNKVCECNKHTNAKTVMTKGTCL